ncbi:MAG: ABC transporter permease [Sphingobacteriales bacterium]|nr:MAG: ABC transporter permease [Sphingobacteriales bacterium]
MNNSDAWSWEIKAKEEWYRFKFNELTQYKELLFRFVRRDLLSTYQQTIIGKFWIFLQPLLTTMVYVIVFGNFIKTSTYGVPLVLFYLPGTIIWNFFSDSMTGTMYTFISNSHIFSKVYFPRIISPLSVLCTQFIRLGIQVLLFFSIYFVYTFLYPDLFVAANFWALPFLILLTAAFGMGTGLIFSVLIAKYRDIENFVQFGLRLFMFATPVLYSSAVIPEEFRALYWANPLTPVIETFRSAFLTHSVIPQEFYINSTLTVSVILITGLILFKKQEVKVMDTI